MPIKSRMSSIMGEIEPEYSELFALEFGKIAESDFVYTQAATNIKKINTLLGQNVCDHKTLYEFNYGCNRTRIIFDFVYSLSSANIDQSVPNLATIYIAIKSRMSLIMGQIESENWELIALEFGKIAESDFVYTPASTNIDQSAPNLVKIYVTTRLHMSSIMDLIGPELAELFALEFENFPYLTLFTLWHLQILTNQYQIWPQYMPTKSLMSWILGQIVSEHPKLFALEFGKIAESDFVYTLASTNIDQSTPNFVKMYMTIRLRMSLIMDLIGPELYELSALELKNLPYLTLFTLYHLQILTNQFQTWPKYI